jgi:predicted extracellular nuclease
MVFRRMVFKRVHVRQIRLSGHLRASRMIGIRWVRSGMFLGCTFLSLVPLVASEPSGVSRLEYLGQANLAPALEVDGTLVGGLSGIAWNHSTGEYYSVSDDPGSHGSARFYRMTIDLESGRLERDGVDVLGVSFLKDPLGQPYEADLVDPEGIALIPGEAIYISSEGQIEQGAGPFIRQFSFDGDYVRDFEIPDRYLHVGDPGRGLRHNRGFESLTLTPDGRFLITATENALEQDGPEAAVGQPSPSRILIFDRVTAEVTAEFFYWTEPIATPSIVDGGYENAGLVDLLALDQQTLISVERSFSEGVGNTIQLFLVRLEGAADLSRRTQEEGGSTRATPPVSKELLLDLSELGVDLDNIEGLGFGPPLSDGRRTLVLVGDDNFSAAAQLTQFLAFAMSDEPVTVAALQGAAHRSPFEGQWLRGLTGRVTAVSSNGDFWIESIAADDDPATSEGVLVRMREGAPEVSPGDEVRLAGRVWEEGRANQLSVTTLKLSKLQLIGEVDSPPDGQVIGEAHRSVPSEVIDNDGLQFFEPEYDGIDFWESLEGMKIALRDPLVVGPTSRYGDVVVVADGGSGSTSRTARGGLLLRPGDFNPECVTLRFDSGPASPQVNVGDRFDGLVTGIVDYDHGVYLIRVQDALPVLIRSPLQTETTSLEPRGEHLTLATFNVYNLGPHTETSRVERLGRMVVENLQSPDILALQEVQDDTGPEDNGVVTAAQTLQRLIESIESAGGPVYDYRQVDPVDGQDGGYPGANIRVVLLFNPKRVRPVDRGNSEPKDSVRVASDSEGVFVDPSPGRLAPNHPAFRGLGDRFDESRKPLVSEFVFRDRSLIVINCHLTSKRRDTGLFGKEQPPRFASEDQRSQQAQLVRDFVSEIVAVDSEAAIVVLGDLNDHEFRPPLRILTGSDLTNLAERAPRPDRYSYNYRGNSQLLDHILVSRWLANRAEIDIVHGNSDSAFSVATSDHDPIVVRLDYRGER